MKSRQLRCVRIGFINFIAILMIFSMFSCEHRLRHAGDVSSHTAADHQFQLISLEQQVRLAQMRYDRMNDLHNQESELQRSLQACVAQIKSGREELKSWQEQTAKMERDIADARKEREQSLEQRRREVVGQKWATFPSMHREYRNVTITHVSALGIEIRHETGTARLTIDQLTQQQIHAYGLDRESARELLAREHQTALAYDQWQKDCVKQKRELSPQKVTPLTPPPVVSHRPGRLAATSHPSFSGTRSTRTVYRVRNSGRPRFYYVFPLHCQQNNQQLYYYWRPNR